MLGPFPDSPVPLRDIARHYDADVRPPTSEKPTQMPTPEWHAHTLSTAIQCQRLEKATLAGQTSDKHPINLGLVSGPPPRADREESVQSSALGRQKHAALFTGHINCSFKLFIRVGIRKASAELGRGLPEDYALVSCLDTSLG